MASRFTVAELRELFEKIDGQGRVIQTQSSDVDRRRLRLQGHSDDAEFARQVISRHQEYQDARSTPTVLPTLGKNRGDDSDDGYLVPRTAESDVYDVPPSSPRPTLPPRGSVDARRDGRDLGRIAEGGPPKRSTLGGLKVVRHVPPSARVPPTRSTIPLPLQSVSSADEEIVCSWPCCPIV